MQLKLQLEHPYAWLDLQALDQNIAFINKHSQNKKIRIATKSVRSVEALKYIESRLTNPIGYMTFTAEETVFLIEEGFDHLLLGYPVYEENSVKKLLQYSKAGKDITFMVDNEEHLIFLHKIAESIDAVANVCIDLNVSDDYTVLYFGTKRSPINSIEKLQSLLRKVKKYPTIHVHAAMGYDAQIAGVTDKLPSTVKSKMITLLKNRSAQSVSSFRKHAVHILKQQYDLSFVNGGGSGSVQYSNLQHEITEITIGSAFFASGLFDQYHSLNLEPAAGYACRIVRQFDEETFVMHGGGYIASGAIGIEKQPVFVEANRFSFLKLEGAGEVQTPIIDSEKRLKIGDTVFLRHAKAGELSERFQTLHTFRGESYEGPMTTYRGDGKCFL